jgi:hypothetical protein
MISQLFVVVFLLLNVFHYGVATVQPSLLNLNAKIALDYDLLTTADKVIDKNLYHYQVTGSYNSTQRPYSAFAAVFPPERFSFFPPKPEGCTKLIQPSESSLYPEHNCEYSTNGAFFTWDMPTSGSLCIGNLISDGKHWQLPTDGSGNGRANFGITANNEVVTGFVDAKTITEKNFKQLITGWGWLVRNGVNYVNQSQDLSYQPGGFTMEKAPRTSVGVFPNGTMILLEIDGEEDINYGPDLFETAELLVSLGVHSAVNIDGGGSSTSVYKGKVVSKPTCNDTPEICERAVASITCVKAL